MRFLRQSTASQEILLGPFVAAADGTAQTGLTIANTDIKLLLGGATSEQNKNSGGGTHIAGGRYSAVLDATDTATVGILEVSVNPASGIPWNKSYFVLEEEVYDDLFAGSAVGYLKPTTAGRDLDVASTGEAGLDFSNALTAVGAIPVLGWLENGTMQAGSAAGTAVLRSATSIADDLIIGAVIYITGGTGAGQARVIYDWVSSTDTASVSPNWTTTPDNTSTYAVFPAPPAPTNTAVIPAVNVTHVAGASQATIATQASVDDLPTNAELATALGTADDAVLAAIATVQSDTNDIQTRLPAALNNGMMPADVQRINDVAVVGAGTSGDKWRA